MDNLGSNVMEFVTRPYVEYKADNGETVYFYADATTRSAEYVAKAELDSPTIDSAKRELLNKFISE